VCASARTLNISSREEFFFACLNKLRDITPVVKLRLF